MGRENPFGLEGGISSVALAAVAVSPTPWFSIVSPVSSMVRFVAELRLTTLTCCAVIPERPPIPAFPTVTFSVVPFTISVTETGAGPSVARFTVSPFTPLTIWMFVFRLPPTKLESPKSSIWLSALGGFKVVFVPFNIVTPVIPDAAGFAKAMFGFCSVIKYRSCVTPGRVPAAAHCTRKLLACPATLDPVIVTVPDAATAILSATTGASRARPSSISRAGLHVRFRQDGSNMGGDLSGPSSAGRDNTDKGEERRGATSPARGESLPGPRPPRADATNQACSHSTKQKLLELL